MASQETEDTQPQESSEGELIDIIDKKNDNVPEEVMLTKTSF